MSDIEHNFMFLVENSADLICRFGLDRRATYVSPSSIRLLGWTADEMMNFSPEDFIHPDDLKVVSAARESALQLSDRVLSTVVRVRRKNESWVWMELNSSVVPDPDTGQIREFVVVMRDITERKLLEEQLSKLALTDGLTGLANRRSFDEALSREWKRTLREGSQISLLLLDIDRFKQFNDTYGHQFGDDCLRAVSIAVRNTVRREIDIVARYGGEEIAVVLLCTNAAGALTVAETVRKAVVDLQIPHAENAEGGFMVTASIGVATAMARDGGTMKMPESLLLSADQALYRAKHEGRNRIIASLLMAAKDT
jgi:diguanylate cyclase (GGDEF)-like protein/PAS domain S-box-containing protein